jgi:hypothetical protein
MKRDYSNLDGELIDYEVLGGGSDVKRNYKEEFFADADGSDSGMFYGADNECPGNYLNAQGDPYASFMNLPSFSKADGDYSEARGRGGLFSGTILDKKERARRRARKESRQDERQLRRTERTMSKSDARKTKAGAKATTAEGQRLAAESLGKESQSDVALAQALAQKPAETKKGLSTGAKVGIALGVLAVLGVGVYLVMKNKSTAVAPAK